MDKENKIVRKFESEYEKEELELLVLVQSDVGGAAVLDDMLNPSVTFIASVNTATGEVNREKGSLQWMIPKSEEQTGWGFDLEKLTVYRVKVRKCKEQKLEPYMSEMVNRRYLLLEILESQVPNPQLDAIREEQLKPVYIEDKEIGKFTLDTDFSWFEGEIDWLGEACLVYLETDKEDGNSAEQAFAAFKEVYVHSQEWDQKFRKFAAEELTDLANDWLMDSVEEGEEEPEDITQEQFARRIQISELSVTPDGGLTVYYSDDDMFWGHVIVIDADVSGELTSADIEG